MNETQIIRLGRESDLYPDSPRPLTRDVYWTVRDDGIMMIAHVCVNKGNTQPRWMWQSASRHQLISLDPLHLEPSIGWMECCGRHGFIRNGQWEPAGDGGWFPEQTGESK